MLQENSYYPFGLEMKALSSQAALKMQTNYKFNAGTNLETSFDVDYYETYFRNYDAQIGRFTGIDALSEQSMSLTTYQFAGNNPAMANDPSGLQLITPRDILNGPSSDVGSGFFIAVETIILMSILISKTK